MKILFLILFFSCSISKELETIESIPVSSVDFESHDEIVIQKSEQELNESVNIENENKQKEPVISLTLYSSLYHSLAILDLLKKIEQEKIQLTYVSSQGFGALIMALYAKNSSVSNVEWSLFKLIKILKGEKIYASGWRNKINGFIDEEFGDLTFEQLKIKLIIPHLVGENKMDFISDGVVAKVLKNNLLLASFDSFFQKPKLYHTVLKRFGIDLSLAVSFIPNAPSFINLNGYNYGLITRFFGLVLSIPEDIIRIGTSETFAMDQLYPLTDINEAYKKDVSEYIKQITQMYKSWKEDSSAGFHFQ